jgi:hypothetical protein
MLAAEAAILLVLNPGRVKTFVFVAIVIALVAHSAFQRDEFPRHSLLAW